MQYITRCRMALVSYTNMMEKKSVTKVRIFNVQFDTRCEGIETKPTPKTQFQIIDPRSAPGRRPLPGEP